MVLYSAREGGGSGGWEGGGGGGGVGRKKERGSERDGRRNIFLRNANKKTYSIFLPKDELSQSIYERFKYPKST